ncbi:hypothetical protein PLEOSDRAFT_1106767 [Pleurotus ostreatus PC15]|uniref:Uncharacterized protein n=1 Tax=Pleurotus ostreatus (strain PC15) TaxID=1137138 RepID=A0A067NG02_PLEO1|nr:hypothetical protein PLEOSDRAFT_1106767 [Pleurotus ostreatus PC15]
MRKNPNSHTFPETKSSMSSISRSATEDSISPRQQAFVLLPDLQVPMHRASFALTFVSVELIRSMGRAHATTNPYKDVFIPSSPFVVRAILSRAKVGATLGTVLRQCTHRGSTGIEVDAVVTGAGVGFGRDS